MNHPTATAPQITDAATPPNTAFRQVKSWGEGPAGAVGVAPPAGPAPPLAPCSGTAPSIAPPAPSLRPTPSCTNAVASTMGSPSTNRASANAGNHSGSPKLFANTSTTWSAIHEPTR